MAAAISLKRRLLALVLAAVALVWIATAVVAYFDARDEIDDVLDAHLAQAAALVMAQSVQGRGAASATDVPALHKDARRVVFQVWDRGELRLRSANAPDERLSSKEEGYSTRVVRGHRWRVFSSREPVRGLLIQVGERSDVRDELARDVAVNLLHPMLYALPLLALLLRLAIARGMRPLHELARGVSARDPRHLGPLAPAAAPREVAPLVEALNRLFARIAASIESERRFTADAAHELRTPVAAVRAQAQVARGAATDDERLRALDNVVAGCDRAAHLVDQLLVLARLDAPAEAGLTPCELRAVAAEAVADVAPYAVAKGVRLELAAGTEARIAGNAALLRVMLRNLVDNAVRYSPAGTGVRVQVERSGSQVRVAVSDEGPGIPEAERSRVFERFYRGLGTGAAGSGLGLSIVKRVADIHGAALHLASREGGQGLTVTATFPALDRHPSQQ